MKYNFNFILVEVAGLNIAYKGISIGCFGFGEGVLLKSFYVFLIAWKFFFISYFIIGKCFIISAFNLMRARTVFA